jgi:hypothetical protein
VTSKVAPNETAMELVLGGAARLFDGLGPDLELEQLRASEAPGVTHLKYRVVSGSR